MAATRHGRRGSEWAISIRLLARTESAGVNFILPRRVWPKSQKTQKL